VLSFSELSFVVVAVICNALGYQNENPYVGSMYWLMPYVSLGAVLVEITIGWAVWIGAFCENKT
jgi:hypothetical protein